MALVNSGVNESVRAPDRRRLALVGYAGLAGVVAVWTWRALHDPSYFDFGGFYLGGQLAWATGHPEHAIGWTGTPVLALSMAITSRVVSVGTAVSLITALNVALVVGAVVLLLRGLRRVLPPVWWWVTAVALLSFGPIMSTVWWKQVNLVAVVLAIGGFDLLRRQRVHTGAALIGLSVAFKPLAILLPFVLLARRDTRRAGVWAFAYLIGLTVATQAFLAVHAGSSSALNPLIALQNFTSKTSLTPGGWACWISNFAPGSVLCRLGGTQDSAFQRAVVLITVALLGAWIVGALRGQRATSWETLAFTCAISPMLSPIEWSHYQVMLAPLFVLLLVRFREHGADRDEWAGLIIAFVLASLMWTPYNTPVDLTRPGFQPATPFDNLVADVAQFAQYVLIVTGLLWYRGRLRSDPEVAATSTEVRSSIP